LLVIAEDIRGWKGKPKELVAYLTEKIAGNTELFPEVIELLKVGSKVEKGTCADILKHVSAAKPELLAPFIDDLIPYINYDLPRVKWGVPEALANVSAKYPVEAAKAIPKLLLNTGDESTVVRWCAAFAITEIAKNSPSEQKMLVPKMQQLAQAENNNGVKNVYLKALKKINKK